MEGNKAQYFEEGSAKIRTNYLDQKQGKVVEHAVFYNPVQVFNRDLTLLVMQTYISRRAKEIHKHPFDGVTIVDALSASGLRAIRFLKELWGVKQVWANDLSQASGRLIKDNLKLSQVDHSRCKVSIADANALLNSNKGIDVIDLDPFGSVVPFLDSAMSAVREGGLLCVTCTDLRVLCGPDISKCYYYYGAVRAKVQDFNQVNPFQSECITYCFGHSQPKCQSPSQIHYAFVATGRTECARSGTLIGNLFHCDSCGNYQFSSHLRLKNIKQSEEEEPIEEINTQQNKGQLLQKTVRVQKEKPLKRKQKEVEKPIKRSKRSEQQIECKKQTQNPKYVAERRACSSSQCVVCGEDYKLNGPIWLGPLNQMSFVGEMQQLLDALIPPTKQAKPKENAQQVENEQINKPDFRHENDQTSKIKLRLATGKKIKGVLTGIQEENKSRCIPLGFNFGLLCKTVRSPGFSKKMLHAAIKGAGENCFMTQSYTTPGIYKSNLSLGIIYDIILRHKREQMGDIAANIPRPPVFLQRILQRPSLEKQDGEVSQQKTKKLPRFMKAGKGMGPKGRPATRVLGEKEAAERKGETQQQQKKAA